MDSAREFAKKFVPTAGYTAAEHEAIIEHRETYVAARDEEMLREKELFVVAHMKAGWHDGCQCEPCLAMAELWRMAQEQMRDRAAYQCRQNARDCEANGELDCGAAHTADACTIESLPLDPRPIGDKD